MKMMKGHAMLGVGIILLFTLLIGTQTGQTAPPSPTLSVTVNNTSDNPVSVKEVTKEFVMLSSANYPGGDGNTFTDFLRINPNGSTEATTFAVPAGKVLVVTDINCMCYAPDAASRGTICIEYRQNGAQVAIGPTVPIEYFRSTTLSLNTGFAVSAEASIRPKFLVLTGSGPFQVDVRLTGYLKPAS